MEYYKNLIRSEIRYIGNQPISLTKKSFEKHERYFYTEKLDGSRKMLLFTPDGVYDISSRLEFNRIKMSKKLTGTLLDCEYFNKVYYVFDVLFYKGNNVQELNFSKRIEMYNEIVKNVNSKRLVSKQHFPLTFKELCTKLPNIIKTLEPRFVPNDLDGIIITPDTSYSSKVYKYKPISLLSIDFLIKKEAPNVFYLLTSNGLFKPKNQRYSNTGIITVDTETFKKYKDNTIVEFVFKNNKFIPLRPRPDKQKPNSLFVINDNFNLLTKFRKETDVKNIFC